MERLRRSFRNSFRRRKAPLQPESSKPHQWEADEIAVEESRGMHVCEQALMLLKSQRQKATKGLLYVSGDGLRVVDDDNKGLIVDQTIEKVSFCAPDRNHERGFSYICRDGTTRRWMCHGFLATKDTGERLSHAVGCAFSVCLERKQKRDAKLNETNNNLVSTNQASHSDSNASSLNSLSTSTSPAASLATSTNNSNTFQRTGSFRRVPMIQRMKDPQECKTIEPLPIKEVVNPYAIERPHATAQLLERQGSFRIFPGLTQNSPFKRQLSLRVQSTAQKLRAQQLQNADTMFDKFSSFNSANITKANMTDTDSNISAMCKELTNGLSILNDMKNTNSESESFSKVNGLPKSSNGVKDNLLEFNLKNRSKSITESPRKFGQLASYTEEFFDQSNKESRKANELWQNSNSTPLTRINGQVVRPSKMNSNESVQNKSADKLNYFETDFDTHFESATSQPLPLISQPVNASFNNIESNNQNGRSLQKKPSDSFDPFDAEWASLASRHNNEVSKSTNPFLVGSTPVKAFEIQM